MNTSHDVTHRQLGDGTRCLSCYFQGGLVTLTYRGPAINGSVRCGDFVLEVPRCPALLCWRARENAEI